MNREAQGFVLLLLGAAVLRTGLSDVSLRYVKPGLRPLLVAAGIIMIVAALATFWYERQRTRRPGPAGPAPAGGDPTDGDPTDGDPAGGEPAGGEPAGGHGHREPRVAWLLVLPLFALILVVPPPLGSYAADRTGTALQLGVAVGTPPVGDPARMTVLNYASLAAFDHGHILGRRRVEITGFVSVGRGGTPYLTRMIVSCCAADAQPVKVGLAGQVPPGLRPDEWLDVVGTYTDRQEADPVNAGPIPFIEVDRATVVPTPRDPYES